MSDKVYPPVVVVDENDNEIGSAMLRTEVWVKGLYHRISSVFIQDFEGNALLQLRSPNVGIYPGCWDQAVGGHVEEGRSYEQTALIEMKEETGLDDISVKALGTFKYNSNLDDGRIINQFERVFLAKVPRDIEFKPELYEVSKLEWFSPNELKELIVNQTDKATPGLIYAFNHFSELRTK